CVELWCRRGTDRSVTLDLLFVPNFLAGRRVHARVGSGMGQPQSRHATETRTPAKRLGQHTPLQRLDLIHLVAEMSFPRMLLQHIWLTAKNGRPFTVSLLTVSWRAVFALSSQHNLRCRL